MFILTEFISAMNSFFTFMFDQMKNFSNFFTETVVGQIILGTLIFYLAFILFGVLIDKIKR